MAFKLTIETSNAAFRDSGVDEADGEEFEPEPIDHRVACGMEVARILRALADRVEEGCESGAVSDINGNVVGGFEVSGG